MSLTSFYFFAAFAVSLLLYFLVPAKYRWLALLLYNTVFFICSCGWRTFGYYLADVAVITLSANGIVKFLGTGRKKAAKGMLAFGVGAVFGILAWLKYSVFFVDNFNLLCRVFTGKEQVLPVPSPSAPIGISFFSLIGIGYLVDVYWKSAQASPNPFKTAVFVGYFPQLTSGPISRWGDMWEQLFSVHRFDYDRIALGVQRILWGVFKKLVISTRAQILVDAIYASPDHYTGLYVWIAALLFNLQLYTDFSGCMDIVIGASECYGIKLPENFRTPFFSRTVQEFWQRWHITLGVWTKDYILYPILRSNCMSRLGRFLKQVIGKKRSQKGAAYIGMLVVWLVIGLWHGGAWKYVLGMGLWFWLIIVLENITEPAVKRVSEKLGFDRDNFGWHFFQSVKVYVLVAVGNMFFRLDGIRNVFAEIKNGLSRLNPWILFNGSLADAGLSYRDQNILIAGTLLLIAAGVLHEKYGRARDWIRQQNFIFRWAIWLFLFGFTLIAGKYGPGYRASEFIYRGF